MTVSTGPKSARCPSLSPGTDSNLYTLQSLWKDQYIRHNEAVRSLVPAEQLLVYRVGEGWERLCNFLQVEVPDVPFPHENKAGQVGNIVEKIHKMDIFSRADGEVRRSLLTISLVMSATIMTGVLSRNFVK